MAHWPRFLRHPVVAKPHEQVENLAKNRLFDHVFDWIEWTAGLSIRSVENENLYSSIMVDNNVKYIQKDDDLN